MNLINRILNVLCFVGAFFFIYSTVQAGTVFFTDDFEDGNADGWSLDDGFAVEDDNGNFVLSGTGHYHAVVEDSDISRTNTVQVEIKLTGSDSAFHVNFWDDCARYYVGITATDVYLNKTYPCESDTDPESVGNTLELNQWHTIKIYRDDEGTLTVYINGSLLIEYADDEPLALTSLDFEVHNDDSVYFDNISLTTDEEMSDTQWESTGGPLGGLGYDIRIHPEIKETMYVTDNYAGVLKSTDQGENWTAFNSGITVASGTTGDAVNIFSLTIDPNDPETIWSGTFGEGSDYGVFKSTDGGNSWVSKINGIDLDGDNGIVFRGFTVQQGNSDVVYAQAEIPTEEEGWEFNRVRGRVFKTEDGGESWTLIWEGDDLARYLIIDPDDSDTLYLSTGIFDREAYNSDCENGESGGVGVLKSSDGGETWESIINGLTDLYVGCLRMHPTNSNILFAAAGNNSCSCSYSEDYVTGGLFKTENGGVSWTQVIENDLMTTINFSPSNPDIIYAGSYYSIYRSDDGGDTWTTNSKEDASGYGPEGVIAGIPIDLVIATDNPDTLFVNNYGGGVFRSTDGARTWESWSNGYSGADISDVAIPDSDGGMVYAMSQGLFKSSLYGENWEGVSNGDAANTPATNCVAVQPNNSNVILISDVHQGIIFRSSDGGGNFNIILTHPEADAADPVNGRQGFKAIVFAPSNPEIVYAGLSQQDNAYLESSPSGTVIYKSFDGGQTFSAMASTLDGNNIRELIVDSENEDIVFAATTNGLYKTEDGGSTWVQFSDLAGRVIEAIAVDPDQTDHLLAGETEGGVWISSDGGESWTGPSNTGFSSTNPDITSIEPDPANPNTFFAGDLYSGIYRSQDNGMTWSLFPDFLQSGLSFRAVNDIALNEDVIYVGTEGGGVFRYFRNVVTAPDITTLISPSGTVTDENEPFEWNIVDSATWYYLWIGKDNHLLFRKWYEGSEIEAGGTCSVTPDIELPDGDWEWRVKTWNEYGSGEWSDKLSITVETGNSLPSTATLVSPDGSATNPATFTWDTVSEATFYCLFVGDENDKRVYRQWYTSAESGCDAGESECSITLNDTTLSSGEYEWWIQTWNESGYGYWSDGMDFSVPETEY